MPSSARAGRISSTSTRCRRVAWASTTVRISASWARGLSPSGGALVTPPATWSFKPATRTMKNSSRFEA